MRGARAFRGRRTQPAAKDTWFLTTIMLPGTYTQACTSVTSEALTHSCSTGLAAYEDDSQSDSEEKSKSTTVQGGLKTDVRACFARLCYGHFPLCWLSSVWDRISH